MAATLLETRSSYAESKFSIPLRIQQTEQSSGFQIFRTKSCNTLLFVSLAQNAVVPRLETKGIPWQLDTLAYNKACLGWNHYLGTPWKKCFGNNFYTNKLTKILKDFSLINNSLEEEVWWTCLCPKPCTGMVILKKLNITYSKWMETPIETRMKLSAYGGLNPIDATL